MKKQKKIVIEEYNPVWEKEFTELKNVYTEHLQGLCLSVEHVGSTSVIGLSSKPILDIDIIITGENNKQLIIDKLKNLGYKHRGDLGIIGREAFKRQSSKVPFSVSNRDWMKHHLYVCLENSISLINHLKFRDYLRENVEAKVEYGNLKTHLAKKFRYDIDSYIEGKSAFILNILKSLEFKVEELIDIENQNKVKKMR